LGREYVTHGLDDASDKLRWAKHHFETLRRQVEPFEQRDTHRISCKINADVGEYVFYVHDLEPVKADWGLMIGDCIHNARIALDYVLERLWANVTGLDPADIEDIEFPIRSVKIGSNASETDIEKAWTHARDSFKSAAAKFGKEPGFSGYLATIEQLQPFNSQNPSIWGTQEWGTIRIPRTAALPNALDRLSRLDNVDKHRVPHAVWASIDVFGSPPIDQFAPEGFKSLGGERTAGPLENGAKVGSWQFETPLPFEWEPDQMDMKRCFPLQVAFGDPSPFQGVLEVLALCLWGVEAVLTIFNPVFESGQPPLPVTAIAEPGS
jgi:hypothetical protein